VHGIVTARADRVATALRWRPEWPIAVLVATAWMVVLADGWMFHATDETSRAGDAVTGVMAMVPAWALLSVAMMMPVALPAVRHTALNSIARRRQWAMALYTAVYVGVWVGFGVLALAGEHLTRHTLALDGPGLLAATLLLAAAWQLSPAKRRALNTCRRTVPLPPLGRKADAGCARFALVHGWRCVRSCWALMLVIIVAGHSSPAWMVALTALIVVEELTLIGRRVLRPSAVVLALTAGLVALGAW
jgi:predicted metal-binding membrane protein